MPDLQATTTNTVLKMIWVTEDNKNFTLTLKEPNRTKVNATVINAWMQAMIDEELLYPNSQHLAEIKEYYIYETNKIDLE